MPPLLLVGDDGVGRRYSVIETAKEVWSKGDPKSVHTFQIEKGVHPDLVQVIPPDGKEIGVDTIRGVVGQAYGFPSMVPSRFVVIDGVDAMTPAAANALLKTLEEPPKTTTFFLLANRIDDVIPTIRSRCGVVRYGPLSESFLLEALRRFESNETKALVYARLAEGSVGRAISFWGSGRLELRNRMFSLLKLAVGKDLSSLFSAVDAIGDDLELGLRFLEHLLRDLLMLSHDPTRLTNLDLVEELPSIKSTIGDARVLSLVYSLRDLQGLMRTRIALPFHTKALLSTSFSE